MSCVLLSRPSSVLPCSSLHVCPDQTFPIVHTNEQEPIYDNRLSASLKGTQETHRNMMIRHCRQTWEESEMTIGYGPPPTTVAPTMQYGEGPSEQRKITPLGPTTHTTRIKTARKLKMDSSQNDNIPAKGRDPSKGKGDRGTENNPQTYNQEPAQDRETGRAKERKQYPVDNPLDLIVTVSKQVVTWGANTKKSRDSETEDTSQKSTGPLPQAVVDNDITLTKM